MEPWLEDQWRAAENEVLTMLATSGAIERDSKTLPTVVRQLVILVLSIGERCSHAASNKPPVPWVVDTHKLTVTCLNCVKDTMAIQDLEEQFKEETVSLEDTDGMNEPLPVCDICNGGTDLILTVIGVGITVIVMQVCSLCWYNIDD